MEPIVDLGFLGIRAAGRWRFAVAERVVAGLDRDLAGPSVAMSTGVAEAFLEVCLFISRAAFFSNLSAAFRVSAAVFRKSSALRSALRDAFLACFDWRLACLSLSLA